MALTGNKQRERTAEHPDITIVPVAAAAVVFAGALLARAADEGEFAPLVGDDGTLVFGGVAYEELDNTDGDAGEVTGSSATRAVRSARSGEHAFAVTGTPLAFEPAYGVDDDTVAPAAGLDGDAGICVGVFTRPAPGGGWFVDIARAGEHDAITA